MKEPLGKKPELLAPAGTLEVFATAVEEGADAVYIGAPALNARALARDFSLEELAAMIDYGHRNGVKVYLAMNSLVREEEIAQLVELLTVLEKLSPDALIIQDLGLYSLVRNFFPSLPLHASTLMGAHNSLAVQQFAHMGFKRVVLAREVTLGEIKKIHAQSPVELEVFVHGALCFSYSGLCLFSSYLGGKSGLRGRCVQPCRRRYTWAGSGKGQKSGYFFSMNDLEAIDQLGELAHAGVVSFKIEGRMRSANYVGSVVKAYRKVIDAGSEVEAVLPEVRRLLHQAMGRKPSRGYFLTPQPADAITPFQSGNIGQFLGKVVRKKGGKVTVDLQENVEAGDRIRHHHEKSGERKSFTLRSIDLAGKVVSRAQKGENATLLLSGIEADIGDSLYKVDVRKRREIDSRKTLEPKGFRKKIAQIQQQENWKNIYRKLGIISPSRSGVKRNAAKKHAKAAAPTLPIWLKSGDLKIVAQNMIDNPARLLVTLDADTYTQFVRQKNKRHLAKILTWSLPPVILEDEVIFYRKAVAELRGMGFRQWMIGHIGQLQLFQGEAAKKATHGRSGGRPFFFGDATLNVLNSLALQFLKRSGVAAVQVSMEADNQLVQSICDQKKKTEVGMTIYGRPPLFTARLKPDFFHFNRIFTSPRGERFELVEKWGQTLALADKPYSLLGQVAELKAAGLNFVVIDLTFHRLHKKEMASLRRTLSSKGKSRSQNSFNFFRTLQ